VRITERYSADQVPTPIGDLSFVIVNGNFFAKRQDDKFDEPLLTPISEEFYRAAEKEFANYSYYKEAKRVIQRTLIGPYYHNIVEMVLNDLAKKTSKEHANKLIDELNLDFKKAEL